MCLQDENFENKGDDLLDNNSNILSADIVDSIVLRENDTLLNILLKDYTTGDNIKWGTDSYISHGYPFQNDQEIKNNLITGWYEGFIRPRADKELEVQLERQRNRAEVFTPSWVIKLQVEAALEDMQELSLMDFVQTKWLEITCGEAPYMVNRYDMEMGNVIPLNKRAGFIDVKFKKINEKVEVEDEWVNLALEIYKASYGYEYQGDSLLLARENLILTFIDNYFYMFGAFPENKLLVEVSKIISWNVFQMDGLTYEVPYSDGGSGENGTQLNLFEEVMVEENIIAKPAKIKLWKQNKIVEFKEIAEGNDKSMKFDVVIGNPPYQEEREGTSAKQLFPFFMDEAYKIAEKTILITPGKFLFDAGNTSTHWNKKMLNDPHLKVLRYEPDGSKIFNTTDIKGGVAITLYDTSKNYEPIITFTLHEELNQIIKKVTLNKSFEPITNIIHLQNRFNLENLYEKYPELKNIIGSRGQEKRLTTSIFNLDNLFSGKKNNSNDIKILGLINNVRYYRYLDSDMLEKQHANLQKYKLALAKSIGSGTFGEKISSPVILEPKEGFTQSFISFGSFEERYMAENVEKYLKTKFARTMLYTLKITQDNNKPKWANVPKQDFSLNSDIDWSQSISEIDQQLYKKYNLTEEEINFIETNVKEME